jgi:RNA polymerase sigma-70 factor (ECF subfamily)
VKVFEHIQRYQHKGRFKPWLYKIANSCAMDSLRKRRRDAWVPLEKTFPDMDREQMKLDLAVEQNSILKSIEDTELALALEEAIWRLPLLQRQVFLLRQQQNLSFKAIAGVLGCSLNTVLSRMHYALENLRARLAVFIKEAKI